MINKEQINRIKTEAIKSILLMFANGIERTRKERIKAGSLKQVEPTDVIVDTGFETLTREIIKLEKNMKK